MHELLRTNDIVFLSAFELELRAHGIDSVVFDSHTSVMEGSLPMIERRLMVLADQAEKAKWLLARYREDHA